MLNSKAQVLIADDNVQFTEILCDYIKLVDSDNIEVIGVANNGLDAVDMILTQKPEIVILDMVMPRLDGIGVLNRIHDMDIERKPLFIILSAVGQNKVIEDALSLEAVHYIEKPFDMNVLISKIIQLKSSVISL